MPARPVSMPAPPRPSLLPQPLLPFVGGDSLFAVPVAAPLCGQARKASEGLVHAANILQDATDYRGLIQAWFALLRVGGRLMIEVPHGFLCERELALPSRNHPQRRRIYSPATLMAELEEALAPNSYRVRLLCDHDEGYNYASKEELGGAQSILTVIERIEPPEWELDTGEVVGDKSPDFSFEAPRTRRERVVLATRQRIILLKLDHLGDFIMGVPALEKVRAAFQDAEITLVVGGWNLAMANDLRLFDHVIAFDAFPRNSSEEKVNLDDRVADFEAMFTREYDLAIDLRADSDTRFFLRGLRASLRAGLGTRAQFPFLDIFLPIDFSRHGFEAVSETKLDRAGHAAVLPCRRTPWRLTYKAETVYPTDRCLVYGPYLKLLPGEYLYIPEIEIEEDGDRVLELDIACDEKRVVHCLASATSTPQFQFVVTKPDTKFEFRIFSNAERRTPSFSYYGGRLLRRGASSVLHQSEYLSLLVDLVTMRTDRFGLLREDGEP